MIKHLSKNIEDWEDFFFTGNEDHFRFWAGEAKRYFTSDELNNLLRQLNDMKNGYFFFQNDKKILRVVAI